MTLSDEQIHDLLRVGNPTDEECRLIRMGWDAAMRKRTAMLEAAEAECLEQARLNGMGSEREAALMAKLEAAEKTKSDWLRANAPGGWIDDLRVERDALRAKVAEMEKQEPVGKFIQHPSIGNRTTHCSCPTRRTGNGATRTFDKDRKHDHV